MEQKEIYREIYKLQNQINDLRKEASKMGSKAYPNHILSNKEALIESGVLYGYSKYDSSQVFQKYDNLTKICRIIREVMFKQNMIKSVEEMNIEEYELYCNTLDSILSILNDTRNIALNIRGK